MATINYYSTWQEALMQFLEQHGHEYSDSYVLLSEFESLLMRNIKGTYFMRDNNAKRN